MNGLNAIVIVLELNPKETTIWIKARVEADKIGVKEGKIEDLVAKAREEIKTIRREEFMPRIKEILEIKENAECDMRKHIESDNCKIYEKFKCYIEKKYGKLECVATTEVKNKKELLLKKAKSICVNTVKNICDEINNEKAFDIFKDIDTKYSWEYYSPKFVASVKEDGV